MINQSNKVKVCKINVTIEQLQTLIQIKINNIQSQGFKI